MPDSATPHPPLNMYTAVQIATALGWAQRCSRLTWLDDSNNIVTGTARHICRNEDGHFTSSTDDVRDCFLRITTTGGFEWFAPMAKILELLDSGSIAEDR